MFPRKQWLYGSCCCSLLEKKKKVWHWVFVSYHRFCNISIVTVEATFIQGLKLKWSFWTLVSILLFSDHCRPRPVFNKHLQFKKQTHGGASGHKTAVHCVHTFPLPTDWDYPCFFLHLRQPFSMFRKTGSSDIIYLLKPLKKQWWS